MTTSSQSSLPTELLEIIVRSVEAPEDLHAVAQTARVLNFLAVEELCARYNVQPWGGDLILDISTLPILSTLAISLRMMGRSLHFLSCDLTTDIHSQEKMMKQTTSLANFLSLLSSVNSASFYFVKGGAKNWESALTAALDVLLKKSCNNLQTKTLARSDLYTNKGSKLSSFFQKLSLHPSGYKKKGSKLVAPNELESCYLQTLPTFLQPFFLHRLNASSRLTTLTFRYIYNVREWENFLLNISLPKLTALTVSHSIIPDKTFPVFLQHHPTITSIDFHHNTYLYPSPQSLPPGLLPRLQKLRTSSDYLVRYFPPLSSFPKLNTVVLPAGDMTFDTMRAVLALQAIIPCVNDITLCLEFSYVACLDRWLRNNLYHTQHAQAIGGPETEPTRQLYCVKTLRLDAKLIPYSTDGVLNLLAQWLGMFPALRRVSITRPCLPKHFSQQDFKDFAKRVERGSTSIQSITAETPDYRTWTWNI